MKTLRPLRRSVSPFGALTPPLDEFDQIKDLIHSVFPDKKPSSEESLNTFEDILNVPLIMRKVGNAPANDALLLNPLCQYLLRYNLEIKEAELFDEVYKGMEHIFDRKTDFFLIDHHNEENCQKMEWPDKYRDVILFSKERNSLIAGYFEPISKNQPGLFSRFIQRWTDTHDMDRMLHFLDFAAQSKNPSFEHVLIFSHPPLARALRDKKLLNSLLVKAHPLLLKLTSPTWEKDIRTLLNL